MPHVNGYENVSVLDQWKWERALCLDSNGNGRFLWQNSETAIVVGSNHLRGVDFKKSSIAEKAITLEVSLPVQPESTDKSYHDRWNTEYCPSGPCTQNGWWARLHFAVDLARILVGSLLIPALPYKSGLTTMYWGQSDNFHHQHYQVTSRTPQTTWTSYCNLAFCPF